MSKRVGLGKGLGALFGATVEEQLTAKEHEIQRDLSIDVLRANPYQPRKIFEPEKMQELVASIIQHGIIQPLIVRKQEDFYEIVAGERRWRAAKEAGFQNVPAVVREYDEEAMMEIAMIENMQRHDLNPLEEAAGIKNLMDKLKLTQAEAAGRLGKSRAAVANALRLLNLPEKIRMQLEKEKLSAGQVRPLLAIDNSTVQIAVAEKVLAEEWNARKVENIVKAYKEGVPLETLLKKETAVSGKRPMKRARNKVKHEDEVFLDDFREKLINLLGTKVKLVPGVGESGCIEIEYYKYDDLHRIAELLEVNLGNQREDALRHVRRKQKLTV